MAAAADAIVVMGADRLIQAFSKGAEALFGYSAAEVTGRNVRLLMPEPHASQHDRYVRRYLDSGEKHIIGFGREVQARKKDGSTFPARLSVGEAGRGPDRVFVGILHETSREARAVAEARHAAGEARRVKSDFLSVVSHELRTPLTIILGNISLLTDHARMPDPAEAASIAQDIEGSANQLLAIINDLLDIADMESGQARLRPTPVQAADLVDEVAQAIRPLARAKGLDFTVESEDVELLADPLRLKQALQNLLDNAVKFTAAGSIRLAAARAGRMVVFEVSDTGRGIPARETSRIFDAFHQADTSSTRRATGTGLGLTLVKRIVELHAGHINVESVPGRGSTFTLAIPLEPAPGAAEDFTG